jgi:hypothetical protein
MLVLHQLLYVLSILCGTFMIYLDKPTNSCKIAQCSCFTLWCVGITKNTSGNLVGVKLGLSRNLCQNCFQRWSCYGSTIASNGKLFNYKVVGNFTANVLDIKFTWFRVRMTKINPLNCGPRWGDGNPRDYIKGGTLARGRYLHPRICSHQSHVLASPWILSPWGRASMKPWRKGAKGCAPPWCRRRGRSPPCRCCHAAAARALAAPLHHLYRYLHHICSGSSSHTPLYRPM